MAPQGVLVRIRLAAQGRCAPVHSVVQRAYQMTDSDNPATGIPAGTLQIDPEEGFGPHIAECFLDLYGEDSVFATATVDCLTHGFVRVLIKSGRLSADHVPIRYGTPAMRESLENLLEALESRGLDKPFLLLMRSAVGREEPQHFLSVASSVLGTELVTSWLRRLEQEDYAGANAFLAAPLDER